MVTIFRKDSDKFEGQSKGSTGWFNLDHEFKKKNSTLEPNFYTFFYYKKGIEGLDMKQYKTFFVMFDSTNLDLININYPV